MRRRAAGEGPGCRGDVRGDEGEVDRGMHADFEACEACGAGRDGGLGDGCAERERERPARQMSCAMRMKRW